MKTLIELGKLMGMLPVEMRDGIHKLAKDEGLKSDDLQVRRIAQDEESVEKAKINEIDGGGRLALKYVSTRTLDKDNEIVVPTGVQLGQFKKTMAFFWGHNYSEPPLGSDRSIEVDDWGVKALSEYADTGEGTLANTIWHLVRQGHQTASSIGFVPLAWTEPGHNDWDRTTAKLSKAWPEFAKVADKTARIITKSLLLEHSDVGIAANNDTEILAVAKSFGASQDVMKTLFKIDINPETKAVIPFKATMPMSIDTDWNGPREVAAADPAGLKVMATWYDAENAELKSAYKLPHHVASAGHSVVWRGVFAAMGALFGARGGVDVPSEDRQEIYEHLAKHYAQFDRTPPEFRSYEPADLRKMFGELYPVEIKRVIRPIVPARRIIKVISEPKMASKSEIAAQIAKDTLDRLRGKV